MLREKYGTHLGEQCTVEAERKQWIRSLFELAAWLWAFDGRTSRPVFDKGSRRQLEEPSPVPQSEWRIGWRIDRPNVTGLRANTQ